MDLSEIQAALDAGKNIAVVGGKVMFLCGLSLNRPKKPVDIANLDSGSKYICPPGMVTAIIGSVDASGLPFAKTGVDGETQAPSVEDRFSPMPVMVNGVEVKVGEKVKIHTGEIVTYLGWRPKGQKYPYAYKTDAGKVYKAAAYSFLAKAS